jgi:L-lactate dehydrogenase (cytochrome)
VLSQWIADYDNAQDHPGGAEIILQNAGGDATDIYEPVHPPQMIENHLPRSHHLGDLDDESVRFLSLQKQGRRKSKDEQRVEQARCEKPPLSRILNLKDMEVHTLNKVLRRCLIRMIVSQAIARKVLPSRALAYYSSGADDEISTLGLLPIEQVRVMK